MERRRDAWKEPRYFTVATVGKDRELLPALNELLPGNRGEGFTERSIFESCKEIIVYKQEDGLYAASLVCVAVCADKKALSFNHYLDAIDMDEEELIKTLAMCEIYEVPVFPDTLDLAPELEGLFGRLYEFGFRMPGKDGKPSHLKLVKSVGGAPLKGRTIELDAVLPRLVQPAVALTDQLRLRKVKELFEHTAKFLHHFGEGITALEEVLEKDDSPERDLQLVFEKYPELFGLTYQTVKPQFAFAERFLADFAFFTGQGSTIFVEIEAPNRRIFNKRGDPSGELTHAIAQVTGWHQWIAQNALYAREKIPNVESPYSWIVIGRDRDLNPSTRASLMWMNSVNRNQYRIMTYDEVLGDARALLATLTGSAKAQQYLLP